MKETDIRDDKYAEKIKYYATEDKKILMKHKKEFVKVPCPACGSWMANFSFVKIGINYLECKKCRTVYASPRPTAKILKEYYQKSKNYQFWNKYVFPTSEKARREKIFKPRVDLLIKYCKLSGIKLGTLIEVGAGFGTFCEEVKSRSFFKRVIGIEPVPDLAETCRKKGIEIIEKPVEEVKLKSIKADVIASFETLEHLFNPRDFILSCSKLLKKGGLLILSCPNMFGFDTLVLREMSKSVGGEHINMFNPESIKILLKDCGLVALDVKTPGKLDAELVRKAVIVDNFNIDNQYFLKHLLVDRWDDVGDKFQKFLSDNLLSSHMFSVAKK